MGKIWRILRNWFGWTTKIWILATERIIRNSGFGLVKDKNVNRYAVSQFDASTYLVIDQLENKEICVCAEYEGADLSERRAVMIAEALNQLA